MRDIVPDEFVEAAEDAAEVLHFAEQVLDARALLVQAKTAMVLVR